MEQALIYELENRIPALKDEIYPVNAPETSDKPYLVYVRINTDREKTLDGYKDSQTLSFMFSIMAKGYGEMKSLAKQVEDFLLSTIGTEIGEEHIKVEDLTINNISETYENELKIRRGIIDFTIYT